MPDVEPQEYDEIIRSLTAIQERMQETIPRLDGQLQEQRAMIPRLDAMIARFDAMIVRYDAMIAEYDARKPRRKRDKDNGRGASGGL
jgi:hypothetical protein